MTRVLDLADLTLPPQASLEHFTPPPRFGMTSFEGYEPQDPSQARARDEVREFALSSRERPAKRSRWFWQREPEAPTGQGLYLDGGFGVGKTHLLAAAYHEADTPKKAYLSFQELVYTIGVMGMAKAKEALGHYGLLCIDEFELDDPGNTLIVKTFLSHAFLQGCRVITTSNTLPEAQGQGRFNAEQFKREIQSIAERFKNLRVEGPDYRQRNLLAALLKSERLEHLYRHEEGGPKVWSSWETLGSVLKSYHPIRYHDLSRQIGTLYVSGVEPLPDQNSALRFVHFIDKLYDMKVGFRASGKVALEDIFHPSYRNSAFAKKHFRCLSRLSELLKEELPEAHNTQNVA